MGDRIREVEDKAKQDFADTLANDEEASLPDGFSYAAIHRASNQP